MMWRLMVVVGIWIGIAQANTMGKHIQIPNQLVMAFIMADDSGLLNGRYDVRLRVYDTASYELVWVTDQLVTISDGAFTMVIDLPVDQISELFGSSAVTFVVGIDNDAIEIPILAQPYAFRSLTTDYTNDTRFPDTVYLTDQYMGVGTQKPSVDLDVNGALTIGNESTQIPGAIRISDTGFQVRHATKWVDLFVQDVSASPSKWAGFDTSIQLVTENTLVGIGTGPQASYALFVSGNAYVFGDAQVSELHANRIHIQDAMLSSGTINVAGISLQSNGSALSWTPDYLSVINGGVSANGSQLTNVGQSGMDFTNFVTGNMIATEAITGDHFQAGVIGDIADGTVSTQAVGLAVFQTRHITDNAIASNNIQLGSIPVSLMSYTVINEAIASKSVQSMHIQPNAIVARHFKHGDFIRDHFDSSIMFTGDHIADSAIESTDIADGIFKTESFEASINIGAAIDSFAEINAGGTGRNDMTPHRAVATGSNSLNSNTMVTVLDGFIGIDSPSPISPLTIGNLDSTASVVLNGTGIDFSTEMLTDSIAFNGSELHMSNGRVRFNDDNQWSIGTSIIPNNAQLAVSGDVRIGHAINDDPTPGTIAFDAETNRFRFYNGQAWSSLGFLIHNSHTVQRFSNGAVSVGDTTTLPAPQSIVLNAPNGVHVTTGEGMVVSATEQAGGWSMVSDKRLKTMFTAVDHAAMFRTLMAVPIYSWEYIFNQGVQHVGPMAQAFNQAFNVGVDDRFITASDVDGVAFSALKHVISEVEALASVEVSIANVSSLESNYRRLNQRVDDWESRMNMKSTALKHVSNQQFEQYRHIDQQLKYLSHVPSISRVAILGQFAVLLCVFTIGVCFGLFGIKWRYKHDI